MRQGGGVQQFSSNEVDLIDEFDEPYIFRVSHQNVNQQKDLAYMKSLEAPAPVKQANRIDSHPPVSNGYSRDLSYMELLKVPTQHPTTQSNDNNKTQYYFNHTTPQIGVHYPVTNHMNNFNNNNIYTDHRVSQVAVHHSASNNVYNEYSNSRELIHHQTVDFEVEILKILYMNSWRSINNYTAFPNPNISPFCVTVGECVFNSLRYDYGISFIPFLSNVYNNFREEPSINETNRCFYLHLAVGIRVHPFMLQAVFRSRSRILLSDGRNGSNDYLALELLLQSVLNPADFVDANVLFHLWPEEFNSCRVCFISDTDRSTIFTCFRNCSVAPVRDVIIHCDGSHFTLLAFDVSLDQVLAVAIANNHTVNFNEIPGSRYSMQREIENIIK